MKRLKQSLASTLRRWASLLVPAESAEHEPKTVNEREPATNQTEQAEPALRTIKDVIDASEQTNQTAHNQQHRDNRILILVTSAAVLGAWFYAAVALFQWCAMRTANETIQQQFRVQQRAYVALGTANGKLAEFGREIGGKPILKVFVVNAGQSVARHLSVQIAGHINTFGFTHRHRFRAKDFETGTYASNEVDLAAHGEYTEYLMDTKRLWTSQELRETDATKLFIVVIGEIQYCDIFGVYHCKPFGARYIPGLGEFIPWGTTLPCIIEPPPN